MKLPIIAAFLVCISVCRAAVWSLPSETIAHYEVAYGQASGDYPNKVITQATEHLFSGLAAGKWYFVVTAISSSGERSGTSPEVSYVFPEPQQPMVKLHVYRIDLQGNRSILSTIYVARKEKDFFQLGIETP